MTAEANFCPASFAGLIPKKYQCAQPPETFWHIAAGATAQALDGQRPDELALRNRQKQSARQLRAVDGQILWLAIATTSGLAICALEEVMPAFALAIAATSIIYLALLAHRVSGIRRFRVSLRQQWQQLIAFDADIREYEAAGGVWQAEFGTDAFWQVCSKAERTMRGKQCGDVFTERVAALLSGYGWEVAIATPAKLGDYGADILAFDPVAGHRVVLQCKLRDEVGPPMARELVATKCVFSAHRAILVTLSKPDSDQFEDLRDRFGLEYWSADDLSALGVELWQLRKRGRLGTPDSLRQLSAPAVILECRFEPDLGRSLQSAQFVERAA